MQQIPDVLYAPADFQVLRKMVQEKGLMTKKPWFFIWQSLLTAGLLALSFTILFLTDAWYWQMLNAALMAIPSVQIAFLVHDSGHSQVSPANWLNSFIAYAGSLFVGGSPHWWISKHNEHHSHPNREDMDPDIDIPILAFSEEQAKAKRGLSRWIVSHQALFFFPILALVSVNMRFHSVKHLLNNRFKAMWLDWLVVLAFPLLYLGLLFIALPFWTAILFIFVHQVLFGLYLGSVFAPNHKGMMIVEKDAKIDFLREQVLTARNVRSHPLIDYFYGGLNYQIEHHLFPYLPRNNLRRVQKIVKEFCREKNIPYHETGIVQSYREILGSMQAIARFTRQQTS